MSGPSSSSIGPLAPDNPLVDFLVVGEPVTQTGAPESRTPLGTLPTENVTTSYETPQAGQQQQQQQQQPTPEILAKSGLVNPSLRGAGLRMPESVTPEEALRREDVLHIVWFKRDLRLEDHEVLHRVAAS